MQEKYSEQYLVERVSEFTRVEKNKLVEITDEMLLDDYKGVLLKKLKEYKYSLQYIIQ
jgi:hypothetical protein